MTNSPIPNPRTMYEVGVEGDLFHEHTEVLGCAKKGCVEVTDERRAIVKAREEERAREIVRPGARGPIGPF